MADNEIILELINMMEWTEWLYGHKWGQKDLTLFESVMVMLNGRLK